MKETIQDLKTKIETCRAILQRPLFLHCMAVKILSDPARYYLHLPHRRWLPSPLIVGQIEAIQSKWSEYANVSLLLLCNLGECLGKEVLIQLM